LDRRVLLLLGLEFLAGINCRLEICGGYLAFEQSIQLRQGILTILELLQSLRQSLQLVSVFFHGALTKGGLRKTARFVTDLMTDGAWKSISLGLVC